MEVIRNYCLSEAHKNFLSLKFSTGVGVNGGLYCRKPTVSCAFPEKMISSFLEYVLPNINNYWIELKGIIFPFLSLNNSFILLIIF